MTSSSPSDAQPPAAMPRVPSRFLRIETSLHALVEELHDLNQAPDAAVLRRLGELDRELVAELEAGLDEGLRLELRSLLGDLLSPAVTIDEVRVLLSALGGWLDGLLASSLISAPGPRPHEPEEPPRQEPEQGPPA